VPVLCLNPSYENFKVASNDSDFLGSIEDEIEIEDDTGNEIARELWLEILTDSNGDSSLIVTFSQYMNLLQSQTTGFMYEFTTDSYGKVNGLVWQTATMHSNFERYRGYISLDTLKREINKWLWPCMSIVMYDEHKIMCLGCEGIMCGERVDGYKFMCNFLIRNTPGCDPPWLFDSLIFKVSFIGKNGLEDPPFTNILLSGNAMNQVITFVPKSIKSKPKYLYDWTKKWQSISH
jgi:hypothetical protein